MGKSIRRHLDAIVKHRRGVGMLVAWSNYSEELTPEPEIPKTAEKVRMFVEYEKVGRTLGND